MNGMARKLCTRNTGNVVKTPYLIQGDTQGMTVHIYQPSRWIISFRLWLGFVSLSLPFLLLAEDSDLPVALVVMETHVSSEPARRDIQQGYV